MLTGMLGAFLARGMDPAVALQSSVYLHGSAGDIAAERVGQESLIASDVIAAIPEAFKRLGGAVGLRSPAPVRRKRRTPASVWAVVSRRAPLSR